MLELRRGLHGHSIFRDKPLNISTGQVDKWIDIATESLVRSEPGRLEWLTWQGVISQENADDLENVYCSASLIDKFALSLHSMLSHYLLNGMTPKNIEKAMRYLVSPAVIGGLLVSFDQEGSHAYLEKGVFLRGLTSRQKKKIRGFKLTPSFAFQFATSNSSNPIAAAQKSMQNLVKILKFKIAKLIEEEDLTRGLPPEEATELKHFQLSLGQAWRLATSSFDKPLEGVKKVIRNLSQILSFDIQKYLKENHLLEGLSSEQIKALKNFKFAVRDILYFAIFNISDPIKGVEKSLQNIRLILTYDIQSFFLKNNLFEGLPAKYRKRIEKLRISMNDTSYLAVNNIGKPIEALERALKNLIQVLKFDIKEFLLKENLLGSLSAEEQEELKSFQFSLSDALRIAISRPKDPVKAVEETLSHLVKLSQFDISAFLRDNKLMVGLSKQQQSDLLQFRFSLSDLCYFAIHNIDDPTTAIKDALHQLVKIMRFDVRGFIREENLSGGLPPEIKDEIEKLEISMDVVAHFALRYGKALDGIKRALRNLPKILNFNVKEFLVAENLLEGIPADQQDKILGFRFSVSEAFKFSVYNIADPIKKINTLLRGMAEIAKFDVRSFIAGENLLSGLSPEDAVWLAGFTFSRADALIIARSHSADTVGATAQTLRNMRALLIFDIAEFMRREMLLIGFSKRQQKQFLKLKIPKSSIIYIAIHKGADAIGAVKDSLRDMVKIIKFDVGKFAKGKRLLKTSKRAHEIASIRISPELALRLAIKYAKPMEAVKDAIPKLTKVLAFDVQNFIKKEQLTNGLSAKQKVWMKRLDVSVYTAWQLAIDSPDDPVEHLRMVLRNLSMLFRFDALKYIKEQCLAEGLDPNYAVGFERFKLSFQETMFFAFNYGQDPIKGVKNMLHNIRKILGFDARAFVQKEYLFQGLPPERAALAGELRIPFHYAQRLARTHPTDPLPAVEQVLRNIASILKFDVPAFIKEKNLTMGLAPEKAKALCDFDFISSYEIWRFGAAGFRHPVGMIQRIYGKMSVLLRNYELSARRAYKLAVAFAHPLEILKSAAAKELLPGPELWEIVTDNLGLVSSIARKYLGRGLEFEDLKEEGMFGLLNAAKQYNPAGDATFGTYAYRSIETTILRVIANKGRNVRLPVHVTDKYAKIRRTERDLAGILGRDPEDEETAEQMDIPEIEIKKIKRHLRRPVSLHGKMSEKDDVERIDLLSDGMPAEEDMIDPKSLSWKLEQALADLNSMEECILRWRFGFYGDNLTLEEIGKKFNLTRERIRQIEAMAKEKLRKRHPELIEFLS